MAIEPVSASSALDAFRAAITASRRSPDVNPDAAQAAAQESDARRVAESVSGASPAYLRGPEGEVPVTTTGTRVNVVPVAQDPVGSMERANQAVERAYASGSPTPTDLRTAQEAYQAEAAARGDLAAQEQAQGARSVDITV